MTAAGRASRPTDPASKVPDGRWRRLRVPLGLAGLAGAAAVAIALHDPNQPGAWLVCPYLATTGFFCPGCGALRALHALLHGDISRAMAMNPLVVLCLPLVMWLWAATVRRAWWAIPRGPDPGRLVLGLIPVVIALYWILRNVPGFEVLGPMR